MKKFFFAVMVLLAAVSCTDDLKEQLANHESRISALETICSQINSNITSMQTVISALQNRNYITDVQSITEGGKVIGYSITFSDSKTVSIYNGEKGETGATPVISAKQDSDGVYYWTVDGQWLLVNGAKVPVTGPKGETGAAPKLKIENDYWYADYGDGKWVKIGPATSSGGAGIFSDIDLSNPYSITFTVAQTGEQITIPRKVKFKIGTDLSNATMQIKADSLILFTMPDDFKSTDFTAIQASIVTDDGVSVDVYTKAGLNGWDVKVKAPTFTNGKYNGDAGILVSPAAVPAGNVVVLEATIVWADGSRSDAARALTRVDTYENIPGIYAVNLNNYTGEFGQYQTNLRKYDDHETFAMVSPDEGIYMLFTGLPSNPQEGSSIKFHLKQNWTDKLAENQDITAKVMRVGNGFVWLKDANNVKYILKH